MSACAGVASPTCLPGAWECDRHDAERAAIVGAASRAMLAIVERAIDRRADGSVSVNLSIGRGLIEREIRAALMEITEMVR